MITFFNNFLEERSLKLSGNFTLLRTTNLTNWISFCKKQPYKNSYSLLHEKFTLYYGFSKKELTTSRTEEFWVTFQ